MRGASILNAIFILAFAFTGPVMAQKMKDNPKCQQWHSVIGKSTAEVEYRESPTGDWKKMDTKTEIEWIMDGSFVQIKNHSSEGITEVSNFAYDPIQQTHISSGFNNRGLRWTVLSSDWSGNTNREIWEAVGLDGKKVFGICTREFSADFRTMTGECQQFTDGVWWVQRKIKSKKVE